MTGRPHCWCLFLCSVACTRTCDLQPGQGVCSVENVQARASAQPAIPVRPIEEWESLSCLRVDYFL